MNFSRLNSHRLLPMFSWSRQQQQVPAREFVQVGGMPPHKDFPVATEFILFKNEDAQELSYTSLSDLLSANRHTCINVRPNGEHTREDKDEDERPVIKNRLVELAARAYLLPSHAQETPANQFFSRQWARFTSRNWLHSHHSNTNLQSPVSCLPSPVLWLDITRAFCSMFRLSHLRPQPVLRL